MFYFGLKGIVTPMCVIKLWNSERIFTLSCVLLDCNVLFNFQFFMVGDFVCHCWLWDFLLTSSCNSGLWPNPSVQHIALNVPSYSQLFRHIADPKHSSRESVDVSRSQ